MEYGFAHPWAPALGPVVVAAYLAWRRYGRRSSPAVPFSYAPPPAAASRRRLALRHVPTAGFLVALLLMAVALGRPQRFEALSYEQKPGADIVLLMDVSASMDADDLPPSRLAVAREVAAEFVGGRPGDRFAVVAFAEDAFTYVPLTTDRAFVRNQLARLTTDLLPRDGSALGSAVGVALNRLKDGAQGAQVVVALTDGAANMGRLDPASAARLARAAGVRIYTVLMGRRAEKDKAQYDADLDEAALRRMAQTTGGRYFSAFDGAALRAIFAEIDALESKTPIRQAYARPRDLYPYFLWPAVAAFLLALIAQYFWFYNPLEG